MYEGKLELIFPRVIHEGGMLVNKRLSKNNGSRGDHGIIYYIYYKYTNTQQTRH